jgi:hypothetical protein
MNTHILPIGILSKTRGMNTHMNTYTADTVMNDTEVLYRKQAFYPYYIASKHNFLEGFRYPVPPLHVCKGVAPLQ